MSVEEVEWEHCGEMVGELAYAQRTRARALALVKASWVHAMGPRGSTIPAYPWTGFVVTVRRKKPNAISAEQASALWAEASEYAARADRRSQGPRDLSMLALMM